MVPVHEDDCYCFCPNNASATVLKHFFYATQMTESLDFSYPCVFFIVSLKQVHKSMHLLSFISLLCTDNLNDTLPSCVSFRLC